MVRSLQPLQPLLKLRTLIRNLWAFLGQLPAYVVPLPVIHLQVRIQGQKDIVLRAYTPNKLMVYRQRNSVRKTLVSD